MTIEARAVSGTDTHTEPLRPAGEADGLTQGSPGGREPDFDEAREPAAVSASGSTPVTRAVSAAVLAAVVVWSFWPEVRELWSDWGRDPNYSHGYLIPIVALAAFWRRGRLAACRSTRPRYWAWPLLGLVLLTRAYFYERGNQWAETVTLLPALLCLALARGGWGMLRRAWAPVAYLVFMIPLPGAINDTVAAPLQSLATQASAGAMRLLGMWVIVDGNVIYVGSHPLFVAEACNGLSMLMSLAATVAAMILLVPMSNWVRGVLALSAVPVALLSNMIRITATGWCYERFGGEAGARIAHDAAGWLMMPTALALVGLEMAVLNWLFVEEEAVEAPPMILGKPIARHRERLPIGDKSTEPAPPESSGASA